MGARAGVPCDSIGLARVPETIPRVEGAIRAQRAKKGSLALMRAGGLQVRSAAAARWRRGPACGAAACGAAGAGGGGRAPVRCSRALRPRVIPRPRTPSPHQARAPARVPPAAGRRRCLQRPRVGAAAVPDGSPAAFAGGAAAPAAPAEVQLPRAQESAGPAPSDVTLYYRTAWGGGRVHGSLAGGPWQDYQFQKVGGP
jgi:hypothetical protein